MSIVTSVLAAAAFSACATTETEVLQKRIDSLVEQGGGVLTIGKGEHRTGALFFRKGVSLHLEEGASIVGTGDPADNSQRMADREGRARLHCPALINADGCDGFRITGKGAIDGRGLPACPGSRNARGATMERRLLHVSNSKNVDISGVTFKNSRSWMACCCRCANVFIHDCAIQAEVADGAAGQATDAIVLDSVSNVLVSNVVMDVDGDAVVLKGGECECGHDLGRCPENSRTVGVRILDCRVKGADVLLDFELRSDIQQRYTGIRAERVAGSVKHVLRVRPWREHSAEVPKIVRPSTVEGVTLANLSLDCESLLDAARSPENTLKNLRLLYLDLRCYKGAAWDREVFANITERNNRIVDWREWAKLKIAVKSTLDGTLQPGLCWFPERAKTEKVPLLVALHSWSFGYENLSPADWALNEARKRGWAFYYPHFRGANKTPESCGSDLAVQDIVDGVEHVAKLGLVDRDRVYLLGGSGGGHMALLMAGRHPEIWAGVYAACPITDVGRWHDESADVARNLFPHYAAMLESACGGSYAEKRAEYDRRSPVTYLARAKNVAVDIITGIHDGHRRVKDGGSVPCGHAVRAFNCIADEKDRIPEEVIAEMERTETVPAAYAFSGSDPHFKVPERVIYLRRSSGNVRLTLFNAGHAGNYGAAADWFEFQRRGQPANWSVAGSSGSASTPQTITK